MPEAPKSLLLRAILVGVSPIVARVLSVPDSLSLDELHEVMLVHGLMKTWSIERPADATFDEACLPLAGEAGEAHVTRRVRLSLSAYRALFAFRATQASAIA